MPSQVFVDNDPGSVLTSAWLNPVNDWANHATNTQTGTTYTPMLADFNHRTLLNNAAAITVTIPANAAVPFAPGTVLQMVQTGAGQVQFVGATGVTIHNVNGQSHTKGQWANVYLQQQATVDTWILYGDTA